MSLFCCSSSFIVRLFFFRIDEHRWWVRMSLYLDHKGIPDPLPHYDQWSIRSVPFWTGVRSCHETCSMSQFGWGSSFPPPSFAPLRCRARSYLSWGSSVDEHDETAWDDLVLPLIIRLWMSWFFPDPTQQRSDSFFQWVLIYEVFVRCSVLLIVIVYRRSPSSSMSLFLYSYSYFLWVKWVDEIMS